MYVAYSGSTGTDYSFNGAAVPIATFALRVTIPARQRNRIAVQNQSASVVQLVRDDGAGNNVTSILLTSGGAGVAGSTWDSYSFKGRLRIYSANAGDQISAYDE